MALKVIGTGYGRTGTHSLKLALEQLGFGKCYHMIELVKKPDEIIYFENAAKNKEVDWDKLFENYQSGCDFPVCIFYKELLKKYPDAKVVHTIRDAESWYKSFSDTIFKVSRPKLRDILKIMMRLPFHPELIKTLRVFKFNDSYLKKTFEDYDNKEKCITAYNKYNEGIIESLPRNKLLIFNVKKGWQPLCDFLNVPVPHTLFPLSNTTAEFLERAKNS